MKLKRFLHLQIVAALIAMMMPARAVIPYGTTGNTSAPTGNLSGSGWQYEGQFNGFLGTVIASNFFITAKHIGGNVGDTFTFNGANYTTVAVFPDPDSDFQIWQVAGSFATHAPLFSDHAGTEVGLGLVVFGRGTERGDPVLVGNDSHLGGWLWGPWNSVQRWGTNVVNSIVTDPTYGKLLRAAFDSSGGPNEAHLSGGDSGGAVFVFNTDSNQWELAGINLAVDGPFSAFSNGADSFNAALFDTTGLLVQADSNSWVSAPNPSGFYATEIAAHKGFIESVVMGLTRVVSRHYHGSAGPFDIDLPETGQPAIECRSGGAPKDYQLVFTFARNVSVGTAEVSDGIGNAHDLTVSGNVVSVIVSGVQNAQTLSVVLLDVNDGINISDVHGTMRVLIADTNADHFVDSADIGQTKSQSGHAIGDGNFREDINVDGFIDSADIAFAKSKSGSALPATGSATQFVTSPTPLIEPLPMLQERASSRPSKIIQQKNRTNF